MFTIKAIRHILINSIKQYITKIKLFKKNRFEKFKAIFLFTEKEKLKDGNIFTDSYFNSDWNSSSSRERNP